MNTNELLGSRISYFRNKKRWSLEELAYNSKVDYSYLCKVEKAKVNCSIKIIAQIADALGIETKDLFTVADYPREKYIQEINRLIDDMNDKDVYNLYLLLKSRNNLIKE